MAKKPKLYVKQNIDVSKEGCDDWYPSSIQDIRNGKIFIAIPAKASFRLPLHNGDKVYVKYIRDNALFYFTTSCLGLTKDNIPLYCLNEPEEVARIQRRRNVRVATTLDVYYSLDQSKKELFKKTTGLDISGGGLRISTTEPIDVGSILHLRFYLPGDKAPAEISTRARVIRCEPVNTKGKKIYHLGLEFVDINRTEQDYIVKYVFNLMIKQNRLR